METRFKEDRVRVAIRRQHGVLPLVVLRDPSTPHPFEGGAMPQAGGVLEQPAAIYFRWNLVFAERCDPMTSPSPMMPAVVVILLLLAAFFAAGVSFGFIQTLLIVAIAASAAMLSAFLAVAWSRQGY